MSAYKVRRFDRAVSNLAVVIHRNHHAFSGIIREISVGGAFIQSVSWADLEAGDQITVWFRFGESAERLGIQAQVAYRLEDYQIHPGLKVKGFGVRFDELSRPAELYIDRFINSQRSAGALTHDTHRPDDSPASRA